MQILDLGQATIQPEQPIVAGSFTTLILTYTAGHPIDDSGYIKIAFRSVSDIGTPQFDDPVRSNYCSVSTSGDCSILPRWDSQGHTRPWSKTIFLKITGGYLNRGEEISLNFGDTSGGSPGWQMQTACEDRFEMKVLVDPIATYQFKELTSSPITQIVPGEPKRAVCLAPSQVLVNESFTYYLKLEDEWGNPIKKPRQLIHVGWKKPGVQTIIAKDDETNLTARSNPIEVLKEDSALHPYWADFHGQTEETVGINSIEDYFTFGRDYGLLDIVAHQANDFQITDEFWEKINKVTSKFYYPGVFVTFPGYEWSGNTPLGGDRNVFFTSEGGKITRSSYDLLPGDYSKHEVSPTASDLFKNLANQDDPKPFVFAHVGGRYADLRMHDPEIELALEIHSAWGTFEWLVENALQRGYRVGICGNSDGHRCRPGASYPGASSFGSLGGLTCVLARQLDRVSVVEALRARHIYATTGNRCLMEVELVTGDGRRAMMGDVIEIGTGLPNLVAKVIGTAPVESVEVRNGLGMIKTLRPYRKDDLGNRIKIVWSGAEVRGRDRLVRWDGYLSVHGNKIEDATTINFWNPNQPLKRIGIHNLSWESITTGGVAGVILTLGEANEGLLEIDTLQRKVECNIQSVTLDPMVWNCGGLGKKIEVYRLPDQLGSCEFSFTLPLTNLPKSINPVYIRMVQEDGHMAWTSPIYLTRQVQATEKT